MLRMKDIASQVGVSVSSVSLVLNNRDAGRVNAAVATEIRDLANSFGYVPNQLARSPEAPQGHRMACPLVVRSSVSTPLDPP